MAGLKSGPDRFMLLVYFKTLSMNSLQYRNWANSWWPDLNPARQGSNFLS
mgnify:CR=1 FL=1